MKQLIQLILVTMPFFSAAQNSSDTKGIQWEDNLTWEQIKQKAKADNKFIFVDAYATWCGPCKKMDKEVYTNDTVGRVVNGDFISVKIQMDETDKDDKKVKSWHAVANSLKDQFVIDAFPSFLFFSPNGQLAHKDFGYKKTDDFVNLVKEALSDPVSKYENKIQLFREGKLSYSDMPDLAREAYQARNDKQAAIAIAKKYKIEYADKLSDNDAFTKNNLNFIGEFANFFLTSNDRYFKFFYNHPEKADSIIDRKELNKKWKLSTLVINGIIRKEEIFDKIYNDGKPNTSIKPDWKKIQEGVRAKYGQAYVDKFFPDEQIGYYQKAKDWKNYILYVNKKIEKIPPKAGGKFFGGDFGDAWQLNMYTWILFERCGEKRYLEKGLSWIDLSLKLEEHDYAMDTKANLLYRLGRISEAIALEEKAVQLSNNDKENVERLKKMKAGLPTWPVDKSL